MAKKHKTNKTPQSNPNANDLRARKKAAVMSAAEKKGGFLLPAVIALFIVAGVAGGYLAFSDKSEAPATTVAAGAFKDAQLPPDNRVTYPVAMFADGKARHFEFKDGRYTIRYFVIRSADGVLRAAFDACDVCWPAGKGYYQEGDVMVCRNCGRKFASNRVNEVKGGCNPAPLNRSVVNGKLVIHVKDILDGRQYFNFEGKV